jgi:hypothetical protein
MRRSSLTFSPSFQWLNRHDCPGILILFYMLRLKNIGNRKSQERTG